MKLFFALLVSFCLFSEDISSVHKFSIEAEKTASSVFTIDQKQIMESGKSELSDILKMVPSIDVVQSGVFGNVAIFIRGANSEHTLVLLDGIELNNPVSNSRFYNLNSINLSSVEKIEIIKGSQSGVYGSDAIGGIISITTKKGFGKPKVNSGFETGTYQTNNFYTEILGSSDIIDYYLNTSIESSNGISSASNRYGNTEDDGYLNNNFSSRIGFNFSPKINLNLIAKGITNKTEIDNFGGAFGDNLKRELKTYQQFFRSELNTKLFEDKLLQKLSYSYTNHKLLDGYDLSPEKLASEYLGRLNKIDFSNKYEISEKINFIFGAETRQDSAEYTYDSISNDFNFSDNLPNVSATNNAGYTELILNPNKIFSISLAGRHDKYSRFTSNNSYRISPKIIISDNLSVFSNYGTGFKAPSLYQLFSQYGETNLDKEESWTYDIGFEKKYNNYTTSFTYFKSDISNLINFDPITFKFANINQAETSGIDLNYKYNLNNFEISTSYSYLDTEDKNTGLSLLRRARHHFTPRINYSLNKLSFGIEMPYTSSRVDQAYIENDVNRIKLSGYSLVNIIGSYKYNEKIDVYSRFNNLFDKEYEDVYGYGNYGAQALFGFRIKL